MITFGNIKAVVDVLDLLAIDNSQEENNALNCILIEQVESKVTTFTTYEPKVGFYIRRLTELNPNCMGEVGDKYLVDYKTFRDTVKKLSSSGVEKLSIDLVQGLLTLFCDYKVNFQGEKVCSSRHSIPVYPGAFTDFTPDILQDSEELGYINSQDFNAMINVICTAGSYSGSRESYKNTVNTNSNNVALFIPQKDRLKIYAHDKDGLIWYELMKPAYFEDVDDFIIEGRLLPKLRNLSSTSTDVHISRAIICTGETDEGPVLEDWLGFETKENKIFCRKGSSITIKSNHSKFTEFKDLVEAIRQVYPVGLINAFRRMHDPTRASQEKLLLIEETDPETEEPVAFTIRDYDKLQNASLDSSSCDLLFYNNEDWAPCNIRMSKIDSMVSILRNFKKFRDVDDGSEGRKIELRQGIKILNSSASIIVIYAKYLYDEEIEVLFNALPLTSL